MNTFYERVSTLCEKHGISAYKMCKDIGISPSIISDLKADRRRGVNAQTGEKIAKYFSVTISYLLGNEELQQEDELDLYLEQLKNRPEMRMLFSLAKNASKEDVERTVKIIEALNDK
ncbi:MAG: helix-turn-helix transcriptional regulator [Clostridia bacterium]